MAYLTRSELLTAYGDNATEAITAQQHRDFVESVMVYGALVTNQQRDKSTTTATDATAKLEFDVSPFAYGMTADPINNNFANFEEGHYEMGLEIDILLGGNNVTYTLGLYADGVLVGDTISFNPTDVGSRFITSIMSPFNVIANAGTLDVRLSSSSAQTCTIFVLNWLMKRLGSN